MAWRSFCSVLMPLAVVFAVAAPAWGIQVSCFYGGSGGSVSVTDRFHLDDSVSLRDRLSLGEGGIVESRQADGTGRNSLTQSITGEGYSLQNEIDSDGRLRVSSSSRALPAEASLVQSIESKGSLSFVLKSAEGSREAGQEGSITEGELLSAQRLYAGSSALAAQDTSMAGQEGSITSGAIGNENVLVATGSFTGRGYLSAGLETVATENALASGRVTLDGVTWLGDESFRQLYSQDRAVMGISGLRDLEEGLGTFDMMVLNMDLDSSSRSRTAAASKTKKASSSAGGSYSSYVLTGYRWNIEDPQIQLYLNPTGTPTGLTASSTQKAIAAAANTWDDAVSQNIFADSATVKIDSNLAVDDPFSLYPVSDGYSVNGWWGLGSYLGLTRWWSNGEMVDGYYSITEADTWYNKNKQWTTDLKTATSNSKKIDLQSVALHELGHSIGLGDLYSLPKTDPRKLDLAQAMNSYNGPQRTLGNGDKAGAQKLYGAV